MEGEVVTLIHCKINDQIVDIFTKPLSETKLIKFCTFLGIQEDVIIGGCTKVISPPESPKYCADGGVLEPKSLLVHHIFVSSRDN